MTTPSARRKTALRIVRRDRGYELTLMPISHRVQLALLVAWTQILDHGDSERTVALTVLSETHALV